MPSQPERIAALEEYRKNQVLILTGLVVGAVAWAAYLTVTLNSVNSDVAKLKQNVKDGGASEIVERLDHPKSSAELSATLELVTSKIRVDRLDGKKADPIKLATLSRSVQQIALAGTKVPQVWPAAFELVSYRSEIGTQVQQSNPPECLDLHDPTKDFDRIYRGNVVTDIPGQSNIQFPHWETHANLENCILTLDYDGDFNKTAVGKYFQTVRDRHPGLAVVSIVLNHAVIRYSGGKLIPISELRFSNCAFDFRAPLTTPPTSGQRLAGHLLTANLDQGSLQLASGL